MKLRNTLLACLAGVLLAAIILQPWGCGAPSVPPGQVSMAIGSQKFNLEVADTPRLRERGLMYRKSMEPNHGMIFVYHQEQILPFWMANTYIPLDILFLDRTGKIISIQQMKPLDLSGVNSEQPAQYAIELNQGTAQKAGVKVGDQLQIPPALAGAK